jgi:hypothetical protein
MQEKQVLQFEWGKVGEMPLYARMSRPSSSIIPFLSGRLLLYLLSGLLTRSRHDSP